MADKSPTFPATGMTFLRGLKRNNNREWFLKHKAEYEESVKLPMLRLIEALAAEFAEFAPEISATPRSLF